MWNLLILIVATIAHFLLTPKPKVEKPEIQDMESPTADAGRPVPVLLGTKRITSLNVLWYGEKNWWERESTVDDDGKK